MEIYKRKQESKKTRKQAFDKESVQEKKKKERKQALDQETEQENDQEKKEVFPFFLGRFFGRERVFFIFFLAINVFFLFS